MNLVLVLAGLMVVLALGSAAPATHRSRARAASRRAAFVRASPRHVNPGDVVAALVREGLCAEVARPVIEHASSKGIALFTLWRWIDRHGAAALDMVEAAQKRGEREPMPDVTPVAPDTAPRPPECEDLPEPACSTHTQVRLGDNIGRDGRRRIAAA